ncbi:2-keto-4-pentenoate hydratase [Catenovulum agarivorans]|uniref:2-keto-4-pentenoate hydratase n=1 Tax=Catenovulum agarivorans TaxID=1172192 RepID=UPI0002E1B5E3|nr:hypothetical protein [Catenovulum agarivorans]
MRKINIFSLIYSTALLLLGSGAQANLLECKLDETQQKQIQLAATLLPNNIIEPININRPSQAYCLQQAFIKHKQDSNTLTAGYKIAFTHVKVQEMFDTKEPAYASIFTGQFLANNSQIPTNFAVNPMYEADLVIEIKSDKIMQASSHLQLLQHISKLYPAFELVTLPFNMKDEKIRTQVNANQLIAHNIMSVYFVLGDAIKVTATEEFAHKLGNTRILVTDENKELIQTADTESILRHPLNALAWLIEKFNQQGLALKAGDKISLGSLGKLRPVENNNKQIRYQFVNWPEQPQVTMSFVSNTKQENK